MNPLETASKLSPAQLAYVDYLATAGQSIDADGKVKKITVDELAKQFSVHPVTMSRWRQTVPHIWDFVTVRRNEIYGQTRTTLIYQAMMKKALQGDVAAAKLILNQASKLMAEKQEIKTEVHTVDSALE